MTTTLNNFNNFRTGYFTYFSKRRHLISSERVAHFFLCHWKQAKINQNIPERRTHVRHFLVTSVARQLHLHYLKVVNLHFPEVRTALKMRSVSFFSGCPDVAQLTFVGKPGLALDLFKRLLDVRLVAVQLVDVRCSIGQPGIRWSGLDGSAVCFVVVASQVSRGLCFIAESFLETNL